MSERLRESLSALMDDEADDLELGRILRAMEDDQSELRETWSRYQLVSSVLQGKAPVPGLRPLDLDAMAEEAVHQLGGDRAAGDGDAPRPQLLQADADTGTSGAGAPTRIRPWRALTSFAVAASVTAVAVVGWQWQGDPGSNGAAATVVDVPASTAPARNVDRSGIQAAGQDFGQQAAGQRGRSMDGLLPARSAQGAVVAAPAASESARLVEAYMLHHAEHNALHSRSGMMPFARMAAFDGAQ